MQMCHEDRVTLLIDFPVFINQSSGPSSSDVSNHHSEDEMLALCHQYDAEEAIQEKNCHSLLKSMVPETSGINLNKMMLTAQRANCKDVIIKSNDDGTFHAHSLILKVP